jgi:hypothetical protein
MSNMNPWLLAAGLLMAVCAGLHAILGGPEINAPVQASELTPLVRAVMAVVWHVLTALFVIFALGLFWSARHPAPALLWTILATSLSFVALFVGIGLVALGSVTLMPQWSLFAAISVLILLGLRRAQNAQG